MRFIVKVFLCASLLAVYLPVHAQDILVNHTTYTGISTIPDADIATARALTFVYRHASIGGEIGAAGSSGNPSGLWRYTQIDSVKYNRDNWVFDNRGNPANPQDKVNDLPTDEIDNATAGGYVAHHEPSPGYAVYGYDVYNGDSYNATYGTVTWEEYVAAYAIIELAYPSKLLIYQTMFPGKSANLNEYNARTAFNAGIRAYAAANNKPLWDVEDILTHDPAGTACVRSTSPFYPAMCSDYTTDGGHPNTAEGQLRIAGSLWWVMARLSGWDGTDPPPAETIPNPPTGLFYSNVTGASLQLTWVDNSTDEDSFVIYRSTDGTAFSQYITVGLNEETFTDVPITHNTTYWYYVLARNSAGDSAPTSTVSVTTLDEAEPLVIHYEFESGISTTTLIDSTANSVNGSVIGSLSLSTDEINGIYSYNFPGTDSYTITPWSAIMATITSSMSVSVWVKNAAASAQDSPVFNIDGASTVYAELSSLDRPHAVVVTGGTTHTLIGTAAIAPDTWTHVAFTYGSSGLVSLYVDGVLVDSEAATGNISIAQTADLYIGTVLGGVDPRFTGKIDDLRVYTTELTSTEVYNLYLTNTYEDAATCEPAAVQTALDNAAELQTVRVPSGNCSWNVKITVPSGVGLEGAGAGLTVITDTAPLTDSTLEVTTRTGSFNRITGFTFDNNSRDKAPGNAFLMIRSASASDVVDGFRIDHNDFPNVMRRAILVQTSTDSTSYGYGLYGVVDNNTFDGVAVSGTTYRYQYLTVIAGPTQGVNVTGSNRPFTRALEFGSKNCVYFENNTVTAVAFGDGVLEGYGGACYVFRFNDVHNSTQGHHGTDSGSYRGAKSYEIYGNDFTADTGTQERLFLYRSGNGFTFENDSDSGYSSAKLHYDIYRAGTSHVSNYPTFGMCGGSLYGAGTHVFDGNTSPTGYPCRDQIGFFFNGDMLSNNGTLTPNYAWNNKRNGTQVHFQTHNSSEASYITANREYYNYNSSCTAGGACTAGVGTGTSLPATCTVGTGFVRTDQGDWNDGSNANYTGNFVFHKCTATNTWTQYYTPLDFPHPLTLGLTNVDPVLTSLSVSSGYQADTVAVTFTGTDLNGSSPSVGISGTGVTVNSFTCASSTSCSANFVIAATATVSTRSVTLTTTDGVSNALGFTVYGLTLTSMSPNSGNRSSAVNVTLTGTDLDAGSASIAVSGTGITVSSVVVVNATTITATFTIASDATISTRTVTVTTVNGTSNTINFGVLAATGPTVTSIAPSFCYIGSTFDFTITGVNLDGGNAALVVSGAGISTSGTLTATSTTISGKGSCSLTAATGSRTLNASTDAGTSSPGITFTVTDTAAGSKGAAALH